ncbi:hypothetical protein RUM44_004371 [Polyplax serrata]|uniref:PHD-type domain-containing protein n=1 Tax=Polyplax serrata TaxID=468196 RepID=A0ABR1B2M7_POLSC
MQLEKRASCIDLQTFTVHFPANRYKKISLGKPGHYPIALIPGQNTDYYKKYTSNELKYFPLNTVIYGPLRPNERHFPLPSGSDGSQSEIDDSSSSDESSSSSSEETQDTEETNSTAEEDVDMKVEKEVDEREVRTPKTSQKASKGRGRRKTVTPAPASAASNPPEPKKRLGRPPKLKLAAIKLKRLEGEEISDLVNEEKPDTTKRVIIHTCKMCHEEESKNKNGEFEGFIQCSQCKGKIHPSCIDLTADMIPKICSYGWQCTDCKSCVKCEELTNEDKMIFCDQCDRGYHIYCVGLSEVPSGNYVCHVCKPEEEMDVSLPDDQKDEEKVEVKEEVPEIKEEIKAEEENMETDPS